MKNSIFVKTALSTLVALTLGACAHNSPENDYPATQKVIKKDDSSALKTALADKKTAENKLKDANENIATLKKEIAGLKGKGQNVKDLEAKLTEANKKAQELAKQVDLAKEKADAALADKQNVEKAKTDADKKVQELEAKIAELNKQGVNTNSLNEQLAKAKKEAEKKLALFENKKEREKEFKTLPNAVIDLREKPKDPKNLSVRETHESWLDDADKFNWDKIFKASGDDIAYETKDPDIIKNNGTKLTINKKKMHFLRHDLKYANIASVRIDTAEPDSWDTDKVTTMLAYTGKPTDLTKVSFEDLKKLNKGNLTYKGKSFVTVKEIEKLTTNGKYGDSKALNPKPTPRDFVLDGGYGDTTFKVNLEKETISGNIKYKDNDDVKDDLSVIFEEAKIKEKDNQLQFSGDMLAKQPMTVTVTSRDKKTTKQSPTMYIVENGEKGGTYEGKFIGPSAEELVGKFVVEQNFKRDDSGDPDGITYFPGIWSRLGKIEGVFDAKQVDEMPEQKYEAKKKK